MNKKSSCLKRLFSILPVFYDQIIFFLDKNKLLTEVDKLNLTRSLNKHEVLALIIDNLLNEDKILMASYSWIILPQESICISITAPLEHKDFKYEE